MKKLVYFLASFIIICSTVLFVGCNSNDKESQFQEIQSITYMFGDEKITIKSMTYFDYTSSENNGEYFSQEDYQNAENKGTTKYYTYCIIEADKTVRNDGPYVFNEGLKPEDLYSFVGKTYLCPANHYSGYYTKIEYQALHISYVNIKFIDESNFYLRYYSPSQKSFITQKIQSNNYVINYFL